MNNAIDSSMLIKALTLLAEKLGESGKFAHILVGGASALVGAYGYANSTEDVDGIPLQSSMDEIAEELEAVAKALKLPADWLNPYYQTFAIYLPKDYKNRVKTIFKKDSLLVDALGAEDITIMKLMAGRAKDQSHILFLKKQAHMDLTIIEKRLEELIEIYPGVAQKALNMFDDLFGDSE